MCAYLKNVNFLKVQSNFILKHLCLCKDAPTILNASYEVRCLAALPNGRLASGGTNNTIDIWDLSAGKVVKR